MTAQVITPHSLAEYVRGHDSLVDGRFIRLREEYALRLPADTVATGRIAAGLRLEFSGSASCLEIDIRCAGRHELAAASMPSAFSVWAHDVPCGLIPVEGDATITVTLPERPTDQIVRIYLPDSIDIEIDEVRAYGGLVAPAPDGPRWIAYGDSIVQGWSATDPGLAWTSVVARRHRLDLLNVGFAGAARGELLVALQIAASPADIITVAFGTNCWSLVPFDVELMRCTVRLFVQAIRSGHPDVPVLVISPIRRSAAEDEPNLFGATAAELRAALEQSVLDLRDRTGDTNLYLLAGRDLVDECHFVDGIHPNSGGHAQIAAAVGELLNGLAPADLTAKSWVRL